MSKALCLLAPAKVNLILLVLGKRPDGYHEIFTLMQKVNLYDVLYLEKTTDGIILTTNTSELACDETNLVYKAAKYFLKVLNQPGGVKIHLKKRIPIAAGLGGGSSDAAITLIGLNRLFGHPLPKARLIEIGAELGSDVPFFFYHGAAIATGRGEIIRPLPFPLPFWYVIVTPPVKVSTKWAYTQVRLTRGQIQTKIGSPEEILKFLVNDLEPGVVKTFKEIEEAKRLLQRAGGRYILLSGSGASVFALCRGKREALEVKKRLRLPSGWKVFLGKGL
jgi:4-diphosphocytidyl-2-C-methyl-D-erythritol kinase